MNTTSDVSMTITPEAEARIAELGMNNEFEQMIAHVRAVVHDLAAIEVVRELPYDTDWEPVSITAYSDLAFTPGNTTSAKLDEWVVNTFPPQVLEHLLILLSPGRPNAR